MPPASQQVTGWNGPLAGARAERSEVWGARGSFLS
jgi:hypothetical protein